MEPFQVSLNQIFPTEPVHTELNNTNLHQTLNPTRPYQTRSRRLLSNHNLPKKLGIRGRQVSLLVTRAGPRSEFCSRVSPTVNIKPTRHLMPLHLADQAMYDRLRTCRMHRHRLQCRSPAQTPGLAIRKPFLLWQRKQTKWRDGQWEEREWRLTDSHRDDPTIVNLNPLFTGQRTPVPMDSREWDQGMDVTCLARVRLVEATI